MSGRMISRRQFVAWVTGGIGAIISAVLGLPAVLLALSSICTHLGCIVHWDKTTQHFACPCHGGVYDRTGNVISGPPPRPLDHYEVKVENGVVEAGPRYRVTG